MDVAWRFRIMIFTALALLLFGDFYGYGSVRGVKSDPNQVAAPTGPGKFQQKNAEIEISEEPEFDAISANALRNRRNNAKTRIPDAIKESCLPKMLCELSAKPEYMLNEKERELLRLIKSPTMPWIMNAAASKWYFAAHMGELLKHTSDNLSGPIGCSNLWPNCPISSKKLTRLSYKVKV